MQKISFYFSGILFSFYAAIYHFVEKLLNRRNRFLTWLYEISFPIYTQLKFRKKKFPYTQERMREMPVGSLGYETAAFLDKRKLQLLSHHESHDILHALLGYDAEVKEEVGMEFFLLGNGKISLYLLGTVLIGGILMPEQCVYFYKQFKYGASLKSVWTLPFEDIIDQSVVYLRQNLNIKHHSKKSYNNGYFA